MKKNVAMLLITALVVMLFQQAAFVERVSAAVPEPPIYPVKDMFSDVSLIEDGYDNSNDTFGRRNYIGFDTIYGSQKTYLQFPLSGVSTTKALESATLVIPISVTYAGKQHNNVSDPPYIKVFKSENDDWIEASWPDLSGLPAYNEATDFIGMHTYDTGIANGDYVEFRYDVTGYMNSRRQTPGNDATFVLTGITREELAADGLSEAQINNVQSYFQIPDRLTNHIALRNGGIPYVEYVYSPNSPPAGTISINNGATYTNTANVTLDMSSSDPDGDSIEMQFSNDSTGTWSTKEPFSNSKSWALSTGDGPKTVHMKLTDQAGNEVTLSDTIIMDATPPVVTGVTTGEVTNQDVSAVFTEGPATLNGNPYTSGTTISDERMHNLIVTDAAGNTTTIQFTIDKTAPIVTGVSDDLISNQPVIISFSDGTAMLNGTAFSSGSTVSTEGSYTLVVTDAASNETIIDFKIDVTAPTGSLVIAAGNNKINSNNVGLTIDFQDTNPPIQMRFGNTLTDLNNAAWIAGATSYSWSLTPGDGERTVHMQLKDVVGNVKDFDDSIIVDTVLPVVTGVEDGKKYKNDVTISFNEGTALLGGSAFTSGSTISSEGSHTLVVEDEAGNKTTVNFSIDMTPPTVTGVINGTLYNINVTPVFTDANSGVTAVLIPDGASFTSGTEISADGAYELVVTDAYGNITTVAFTIDKTPPTGSLLIQGGAAKTSSRTVTLTIAGTDQHTIQMEFSNDNLTWSTPLEDISATKQWDLTDNDGSKTVYLKLTDKAGNTAEFSDTIELDTKAPVVTGVTDGEITNEDKTISFNEGTATLKVEPLGAEPFVSNTTVTKEGVYVLVVTDDLGHSTTKTFTIDKTNPILSGVNEGDKLNEDVTVTFNEGTAVLGSNPFTSGSIVSSEGIHKLVVTDAAGNVTTVNFSIDKTLPNVTGVINGKFYNTDQQPSYSDNNGVATAKLNATDFVSGATVSEERLHTLVVTDDYGNSTTITFTIDKTLPTGSISINNGDVATTSGNVSLTYIGTDLNDVVLQLSNDGTDWKPAAESWQLSNGYGSKTVYLKVTDEAGNSATFSDAIDYRSVPVVSDSSAAGTEDTALTFAETDFGYSNADSEALDTLTILTLPENGKLQYDGTAAAANQTIAFADISKLQFIPAANWHGTTSYEWTAAAGGIAASGSVDMAITAAAVNDAPTAEDQTFSTTASAKIESKLAASDVEQDALTYAIVDQPVKGTVALDSATGEFSFEPESGYYADVTFTYKANDGLAVSNAATVTIKNNRPPSGGGVPPTIPSVTITIEGIGNHSGIKAEIVTKDGQKVVVVSIDGSQLTDLINGSNDKEITIDVGSAADNAELAMDRDLLALLESGNKTINLVMNGTGYGLSSSAIREVLKSWDDSGKTLKIEIKQADQASTDKLEALAEDKGYELLVTPMSYQLYFQNGDSRIDLTKIKGYITIAYGDEELEGKSPKTAVLLLPNGKLVHVPTKIDKKDGKFEIKVHSFANGVFSLIDYEKSFSDVSGWAKAYVEELASRLIVQGTGEDQFEPNRSVTRAEFAAIITGALGLYNDTAGSGFTDVSQEQWFAASLTSASDFGLISGYADGSFRPGGQITREEAMVILARALELMELEPSFTEAELEAGLHAFEDSDKLKGWSKSSVALTVQLGIVNGSGNRLNPGEPMTRAQLAAVIVKLLETGQFI
ncbi:S-layer homology domain-containing protein [Paenibacillus harenae]|uniref:S-layer homology domain-containing protein n=1 Tax=Paenibacillus harenae TaxID=306543 RepID=UPI000417DE7E|nr:S-layer homology domain-containing protein [Paenibacillus harenae]